MDFRVNVKSTVRVQVSGMSAYQMRAWGERAIEIMQARIARGVNLDDAPASALSKSYARAKRRMGQPPIRNLRLSGKLLNAMKVTRAQNGSVRIGFTSRREAIKAHANQEREPMFGLSAADQQKLMAELQREWNRNFLGAVAVTTVAVGAFALSGSPAAGSGSARNVIVMTPATTYLRMAA